MKPKKLLVLRRAASHQVPLDDYRANLEKIVARLKKTGAALIWCSTTPMNHPDVYRLPDDVDRYNEVAKEVMEKNGVRINDLNRTSSQLQETDVDPRGGAFHSGRLPRIGHLGRAGYRGGTPQAGKIAARSSRDYLLNVVVPNMASGGILNLQCGDGRRVFAGDAGATSGLE